MKSSWPLPTLMRILSRRGSLRNSRSTDLMSHFTHPRNDGALKASWEFHDYPRAGDPTKGIVIVDGMDSIDASLLDTNLDTHSYFAAQKTVVSDLQP